jgi:hypothetical protein
LGVQRYAFQVMPDPQLHQVVACKLRAGHLEAVSSATEVKLDLIGYLTAKQPFNSPRQQVSVIT